MNLTTVFPGAYWTVLVVSFLALAMWESHEPARQIQPIEGRRWTCHLLLTIAGSLLVFGILRWSSALAMAALVANSRFGLLNRPAMPFALRCILTVVALDFTRFATHRLSHAIPVLWRFHQIHHSDPDYDVSLAGRRHPVESVFSNGVQLMVIALLAPPLAGVFVSEILTAFQNVFLHANIDLPDGVLRRARRLLFTPDLHRIHHSADVGDHDTNFGDLLPVWDRLSGTYLQSPVAGREGLVIGLTDFPAERSTDMFFLLALPFRRNRKPDLPEPPVAAPEYLNRN